MATHEKTFQADIGIRDGKFAKIGNLTNELATTHIEAIGLTILPGVIDTQVHFREPGNEHKETLQTGSLAAVMGGVTAVFEMPNTNPATTTEEAIKDKVQRAYHNMHCDFAFYVGATGKNTKELPYLESLEGVCGVKVFMGSSTGDLLVESEQDLKDILQNITRRAAFHSEDEMRLRERKNMALEGQVDTHHVWRDEQTAIMSTQRLLKCAREAKTKIHVLHITTKQEMELLAQNRDIASVEVTPQHLTLNAEDCYRQLGTFAQMNPPIREQKHQDALWKALQEGIVDVIGSDHAPHTREEKEKPYPQSPSGMPGVQTLLPLMLNHVAQGRLSLNHLVELTSYNAHRLFGFASKGEVKIGNDADLTFVDLKAQNVIEEESLASKCGWSPFAGQKLSGNVVGTMIRGQKVMWENELVTPAQGQAIKFQSK